MRRIKFVSIIIVLASGPAHAVGFGTALGGYGQAESRDAYDVQSQLWQQRQEQMQRQALFEQQQQTRIMQQQLQQSQQQQYNHYQGD